MRIPPKTRHTLALLGLVGYVFLAGGLVGAWNTNPPAGYTGDTFKQLYKAKSVLDFFPNLAWDYLWAAGIPSFRAYPLWPYYLLAAGSRITGVTLERCLALFAFGSYVLIGLGMYLASYAVTKNSLISLSTALFVLSTPVIWAIHVVNGLFNEIVGLVFFPIALLLGFRVAEKSEQQLSTTRDFKLLILISAAAISFHPLIGTASFLVAAVVVLFSKTDFKRRIALTLGGLLLALGLNSYLIVPLVTSGLPNVARIPGSLYVATGPLASLFVLPSSQSSFALQPWAWPVTLALVALAVYKRVLLSRRSLALVSLVLISVALTPVSGQLAVSFLSFVLLGLLLAVTSGTLLGLLSKAARNGPRLLALALTISILFASLVGPIALSYGRSEASLPDPTLAVMERLQLPRVEANYRIAVSGADAWTSQWFNYRFDIPQTSSYAGLSLINVNWNTWFGEIWHNTLTPYQSKFLLDWWGAKWILVNTGVNSPTIFLQNPQDYILMANITEFNYLQFLYTNASPIVAPTNAYTILVAGDDAGYNAFFRAMSFDAYGSRSAIPIRDTRSLEDYSLEELRSFDVVLLYGFAFQDKDKAFSLLNQYVHDGGALLVDSGYSAVSSSSDLPECFPVSSTFATDFGRSWQFTAVSSQILSGIDADQFAPAVYGAKPWGLSASSNSSVRDWAKPILWDAGHPVIVAGSYGKGRVLWTGLNLPYHILSYGSRAESRLLSRIIEWAVSRPIIQTDFEMHRPDPQHVTISVRSRAKGILLKENFFTGWKATIKSDSLRDITIWRAGPDFMYVRLPDDGVPLEVSLEFTAGSAQVLGIGLSAIFLVIVACVGRMNRLAKRLKLRSLQDRVAHLRDIGVEE